MQFRSGVVRLIFMMLRRFVHSELYSKISPRYPTFIKWSALGNCVLSVESILSTHCLLNNITQHHGNAFSVSLNYLTKDIGGQLGGLYVVHKTSMHIDKQPRKYMWWANILFQGAVIMDHTVVMLPATYFIPLTICSTIGKNIAFIYYGSLNAKCMQQLSPNSA